MSEKVIVTKSKLTTLGDKVRKIKGTSTKYTLDQINEELDNVSSGPVAEEWDGAYEEISNGYTVTLYTWLDHLSGVVSYSLDDGSSWEYITESPIVLENVSTIKFNSEYSGGTVNIGTTEGGSDIYNMLSWGETDNITLNSNTDIYLTRVSYDFD